MDINWYPGHMAKTRRLLLENLKLVDVVIELLDARIPCSSKNPDMDSVIGSKPRIFALNKADLADERVSQQWDLWFSQNKYPHVFIDSITGKGFNTLRQLIKDLSKPKLERNQKKGILFTSIKTMAVGIPNVGKSSLINKLAGKSSAKTGDKPGVTKGKQWIRIDSEIDLLDTPGILQPKIESNQVGLNLAFTGAIKDEILDTTELAAALMGKLKDICPEKLVSRYNLNEPLPDGGFELLESAGRRRGCLVRGGEADLLRISSIVLDEFRGGRIGRISLERPNQVGE